MNIYATQHQAGIRHRRLRTGGSAQGPPHRGLRTGKNQCSSRYKNSWPRRHSPNGSPQEPSNKLGLAKQVKAWGRPLEANTACLYEFWASKNACQAAVYNNNGFRELQLGFYGLRSLHYCGDGSNTTTVTETFKKKAIKLKKYIWQQN